MAGNKALKKFSESKIPKKGQGKPLKEIDVYKEPNTNSEIIGKIKIDKEVNWISKSICDDREWIRCDQNQNFGYIIGYEKDGTCNFDVGKIKEVTVKKENKPHIFVKNDNLTDEDIKLGELALNEILGEEDNLKNCNDISNSSDKSTEDNNSIENINNEHVYLDEKYDNLNDINWNDINFQLENNFQIKIANDIFNEMLVDIEKEEKIEKPKIIEFNKDEQKDNNKKEEETSTFKRIASTIVDLLPGAGSVKAGLDSITGIDIISNEKLTTKERLMCALCIIPGMNYVKKGLKIGKTLNFTNKAGKQAKASKIVEKVEKIVGKKGGKKEDKNIKTLHDNHNKGNPNNKDPEGKKINPYYYHEVHAKSKKDAYEKALKDSFGNKPIDHGDHFHQSRKREGNTYKYGNTHYTWGKNNKSKKDD